MCRSVDVEGAHHGDELGAVCLLEARVGGDFLADGGAGATLVFVGGVDVGGRVELQQAREQAVVELVGIAGGKVGAAGAADQQRIAGEDMIAHEEGG